ncbi:Gfo/Idh/MocA family oxidoreductase [Gemmatimonas aurantiaca]|nr:Gfo/Idh/MocA family oxidoreductase [Gemmatimonas aurantiaca]
MKNLGIIGIGDWGKNLLRNFYNLSDGRLKLACDLDAKRRETVETMYPGLATTDSYDQMLHDDSIGAIIIGTPPNSHFELAMAAIKAGKDVFVEKPLVLDVSDGEKLVAAAKEAERIIMVGHIMIYHPATLYLKKLIDSGELGEIYYMYSSRVNLGKVRAIENAWWSFAPHDISIILFLLNADPIRVTAVGNAYLQDGIEDVVFTTLHFADGKMAHIHVSWLDPHKDRKITVVGSKKMAVFNDTEASEKIRIYDKGADRKLDYSSYADYLTLRTGDIIIPKVPGGEPLADECRHFLECIDKRQTPRSDGVDGLRTLKTLEAAQRSMEQGGAPVDVK